MYQSRDECFIKYCRLMHYICMTLFGSRLNIWLQGQFGDSCGSCYILINNRICHEIACLTRSIHKLYIFDPAHGNSLRNEYWSTGLTTFIFLSGRFGIDPV